MAEQRQRQLSEVAQRIEAGEEDLAQRTAELDQEKAELDAAAQALHRRAQKVSELEQRVAARDDELVQRTTSLDPDHVARSPGGRAGVGRANARRARPTAFRYRATGDTLRALRVPARRPGGRRLYAGRAGRDAACRGTSVTLSEARAFEVLRIGASPLPHDGRPCAYLLRPPDVSLTGPDGVVSRYGAARRLHHVVPHPRLFLEAQHVAPEAERAVEIRDLQV